jgi:probable rRNA maturation factor
MTVSLTGPPASGPAADTALLYRRAQALLEALGHGDSELSLVLVDDAEGAKLNEGFRGRQGPTDVLSFSLLEGDHAEHRGALLGDVVIAIQVAARQAAELGHGIDDELLRLTIHGVLHLLGHDHAEVEEARVMEARERELWEALSP